MRPLAALGGLAAAGLGWGWFEAGWPRLRTLPCPVGGLPPELEGVRVAHLSDFHLGVPSRGARAVEAGVDWVAARRPDLVVLTGDLLTHPRGAARLRELTARIPGAFAVLGNHDVGVATDPSAARSDHEDPGLVTVLADDAAVVELRGRRVQLVGVDPRTYLRKQARPERLADPGADLRVLLCHFPAIVDSLPPGAFDLVLAGHYHDGQIAVPYGLGKLRLGDPGSRHPRGVFRLEAGTLHVSPGLGTSFVPFRLFARPEATELILTAG